MLYNVIQEHFKGGKNHHVESARRKLNAHRFGPDIERDISKLLTLISELEVAQKMEMPESQKFGILQDLRRVGHNTNGQASSDGGQHGNPSGRPNMFQVSNKRLHKT